MPDMSQDGKGQKGAPELPFTPWGEAEWKGYDAANGDYTGACLPFGMTRSMNTPEPMQFMQSDKYLSFLFEQNSWFTVVPIDGRPHRDGIPTWFGDSVGHWEGDTLVVDTVNFNGKTRLDTIGHPHSDQLHLTQRFSRPDLGHLTYEVIVDNPKTFTQAMEERQHADAAAGLGNDGVLLRGEQQEPLGGHGSKCRNTNRSELREVSDLRISGFEELRI